MTTKRQSRADRWQSATARAREAQQALESALSDLSDLQQEYEEWKDNLPDSLQSGPTADKLDAVCDLDITSVQDDLSTLLDELEGVDLPLGFGRD